MREILFKAKAINRDGGFRRTSYKNGDWVYGIVTRLYDDRFPNLPAEMTNTDCICGIKIDHNTISQFTGLTDKNGKKIFEGDLLNGFEYPYYRSESNEHNYFAEVVWFDKNCAFGLVTHKYPTARVRGISAGNTDYIEDFNSEEWEVIGNILDNPELLKGE